MTTKVTIPIVFLYLPPHPSLGHREEPAFETTSSLIDTVETKTKALVITLRENQEDKHRAEARLEELHSLVKTMGAEIVSSLIIPLRTITPATLIGSGKVAEVMTIAEEAHAEVIIFDHDLPPRCQRNLEEMTSLAVIDRQEVILQIFSDRAATKEAVLQVDLARQEYSLPRLTRKWTHLSRQQGGAKGTRGEGETQLELDRRIVANRITQLKEELKKIEAQRAIQRKSRSNGTVPTAAIVGYTNAGKSSLLNLLAKSDVLVEDKLFATLDPTTRRISFPNGGDILLTDTVGFVSDLPHQLVNAFKSTLEEASHDDFIIHVCDAAHPDMLQCYDTTMEVLASLGCEGKPMVVFINKMDMALNEFAVAKILSQQPDAICGSIKDGTGIDKLMAAIEAKAHESHPEHEYLFPNTRHDLVALVRNNGTLIHAEYLPEGILVKARVPERLLSKFEPFERTL